MCTIGNKNLEDKIVNLVITRLPDVTSGIIYSVQC